MNKIIDAALALIERWDTPLWKNATHTAELIQALRESIRQLAEEPEEYEYELWGAVAGAPGGRWSVTQVNPEAVWPTGVALYVRRVKK
jgi:hypothetical protein